MNKVRFHYGYPINIDIDTDKQVDVYIDQIPPHPVVQGSICIVILEESRKGDLFKFFVNKENSHLYTHLLTFYEEILLSNSKAQLFHFPNTWVRDIPSNKTYTVSTVVGGKKDKEHISEGYALRHELWHNRHLIKLDKRFYLSGNAKHSHRFVPWRDVNYSNELVLGADKRPMFDSMFHIAIENTSINNYFSEKLLDCFRTYTIPIYYGCPNIADYFNIEGIFPIKSVREIIRVCNHITPDVYDNLQFEMADNFNRASITWENPFERLKNEIITLIK